MKTILFTVFPLVGCSGPKTIEPKFPDGWTLVDCSECSGVGKVTYDANHWIVTRGFAEPGTFQCPICQGDKQLYERSVR